MRKTFLLLVALLLLFGVTTANAYTVFFGLDDSVNLPAIQAFQLDLSGITPAELDNYSVHYQGQNVNVGGVDKPGSVYDIAPGYPWLIEPTGKGFLGSDNSFGIYPLAGGVVLSMVASQEFGIDVGSILFSDYNDPQGVYRDPFVVNTSSIANGAVFTCTAVPIPSTLLLLGGGLVGLVGLKRRNRA